MTLPLIWPVLAGATALAFALSFDEFIITFFVIGPDSTLPMFIWSGLRRTVDPSINVVSTLLLAITLVFWVIAFSVRVARRAWSHAQRAEVLGEAPQVSDESRLELEGITHRYGSVTALEDVSLTISDGEFVTLLGPSGCGKTTLLRIIAGFIRPSEGRLRLQGRDITRDSPSPAPVNMVFQRGALPAPRRLRERRLRPAVSGGSTSKRG